MDTGQCPFPHRTGEGAAWEASAFLELWKQAAETGAAFWWGGTPGSASIQKASPSGQGAGVQSKRSESPFI